MARTQRSVIQALLHQHGSTYAEQAGIRLADRPRPLYQLLVLSTLLSARISAEIAVAAARELFAAGYTTSQAMQAASWQDRVDALGRGHYRRYDESTSRILGNQADMMLERWRGDLRKLRDEAHRDIADMRKSLMEFPGIGPSGTDIFLREVQVVWPEVVPYLDERVTKGAARLGLPANPKTLARLTSSPSELAHVAAALVRVSRNQQATQDVMAAASR